MDSLVFWSGTLWTDSLEDRFVAARAGGFDEISLFPTDVPELAEDQSRSERVYELSARYGVDVTILDALTSWLPNHESACPEERQGLRGIAQDDFFSIGAALDIDSFTVIEPSDRPVDVERASDYFGRICDRAAERGWRVHLEFIPFTGIPDLETAWRIVDSADRHNGGLVFDTWHYYRGRSDDELLRKISGDKIFRVQVSDAPVQVTGNLREDSLHHRKLPGDGDADLLHQIQLLQDIGDLDSVGVEVISDSLRAKSPNQVGTVTGSTLRNLLEELDEVPGPS
jgi:sugar phosphate isomerase/epimerase